MNKKQYSIKNVVRLIVFYVSDHKVATILLYHQWYIMIYSLRFVLRIMNFFNTYCQYIYTYIYSTYIYVLKRK